MSIVKGSSNNTASVQIIPDQQIAMGYDDDSQMGTATFCVDSSDIELHGQPISTIGFGSSMDFRQTQQDLGVDVSGSVSVGKFSGSLSAQYARSIQDVGYSMSFSFVYKIILPSQVLHVNKFGPDALNSFGLGAFNESKTLGSLDRFKEICGNKFVVQEESGAKLYTTLNVKFNTQYDKNKFAMNFKGSLADLGSAALTINNLAESYSISGSIELSAVQEGGNVMKLAGIFGPSQDNNILKCRLDPKDIQNCDQVINDIINYAKQDFVNQISYNNSTGKIVGVPTSTGYSYLEYDKIGIDDIQTGVTPEIMAIRKFFGETEDTMQSLNSYLNTLVYSGYVNGMMDYAVYNDTHGWAGKWYWEPEAVDIEQKAQLQASYANVNKILNALESPYSGAIQCYKDFHNCDSVKATIDQVIADNPIADNTIAFFKKAYSLNVNCNGVDYGFRFMLPVGKTANGGVKYLEKSDFFITNPAKNVTMTNYYALKIASDNQTASLGVNSESYNCGQFNRISNPEDLVSVYRADPLDVGCISAICPIVGQTPTVTFFEVDSPI